ncbi:MAG: sodium-dependent transporter [Peptostreptococcaceae bacterium]|nr:sodium-dependent transporter [Peptostreptococcaceae bacterium]MDY5739604.1 sodium-dependent transporter [Anaerovoracaceae bacterium]
MDNKTDAKGKFKSNFGFLMAAIGAAVGLGNIWGFPFKMGRGGGFAFLAIYIILAVVVGYCCMLGELSIGRKAGKASIGAYGKMDKRFTFNGWFATLTPVLLLCFYCTLGGYCLKYTVANFGELIGASFGTTGVPSEAFFAGFITDTSQALIYGMLFLIATILIVMGGVSGGIERFSVIAMPALFVMLLVIVVRSATLPGAVEGLKFMFKPDFEVFKGTGWISVLALAGGQMFFSLSLASGCLITYGSYLDKSESLEKNAAIIIIADTIVALLAGVAVMPAVFAFGLDPAAGPGLLFVTLQTVFNSMGTTGAVFGFIFYFLVFIAALTSSIGMIEGAASAFMDRMIEKGKKANRMRVVLIIGAVAGVGTVIVSADALGKGNLPHLFGFDNWIDTIDLFAEGFMMPIGGLIMAVLLGWIHPFYVDDEVKLSSSFKSQKFFHSAVKWIAPIFMLFILIGQINDFFKLGLF